MKAMRIVCRSRESAWLDLRASETMTTAYAKSRTDARLRKRTSPIRVKYDRELVIVWRAAGRLTDGTSPAHLTPDHSGILGIHVLLIDFARIEDRNLN